MTAEECRRLTAEIDEIGDRLKAANRRRSDAVVSLWVGGMSQGAISRRFGVSRTRVQQIIARVREVYD